MNTLAEALSAQGLRWKHLQPGRSDDSLTCPRCFGGPKKDGKLSLTVDLDGQGAAWQCWRKNSCGWTGGFRLNNAPKLDQSRPVREPPREPKRSSDELNRPDWLYAFFSERKIGARTVDHFGIYATIHWFRDGGDQPAIVFPFRFGGKLVNRKYRTLSKSKQMSQDTKPQHTLFNVDALGAEPAEIVWVEGEPDVMALFECGVPHAVTLKDGAPDKPERTDQRYEALRTHEDLLTKAKRIVLAGDNDLAGVMLREELARRLGKHRCFIVAWPDGCKDACDVLRAHGPDAVLKALALAKGYPIEGLRDSGDIDLESLYDNPAPATLTTGVGSLDEKLHLPADGRLCVVTGYPTGGKTTWMRFISVHTAATHQRRWLVFSPEHQPVEHFVAECAEVLVGKPFYAGPTERMSKKALLRAKEWFRGKIIMLVNDANDTPPTITYILEKATAGVLRYGITDLLIDPWNEIVHTRGALTETDYTGQCLQAFKSFCYRHGCNVWIVAHPAKPQRDARDDVPGGYDISGSQHWANKADLGLTVHSISVPENPNNPQSKLIRGPTTIHVWKTRNKRWGVRDTAEEIDFVAENGRYMTPISRIYPAPRWMEHQWD